MLLGLPAICALMCSFLLRGGSGRAGEVVHEADKAERLNRGITALCPRLPYAVKCKVIRGTHALVRIVR